MKENEATLSRRKLSLEKYIGLWFKAWAVEPRLFLQRFRFRIMAAGKFKKIQSTMELIRITASKYFKTV